MKNLESNGSLKKIPKQSVLSKQSEIIEKKISILKEIEWDKEKVLMENKIYIFKCKSESIFIF